MTLTDIRTALFGYNRDDVCTYISELNELHTAETKAVESMLVQQTKEFKEKNSALLSENTDLKESSRKLTDELASIKALAERLEAENAELKTKYAALEDEAKELRDKSDLISTAIINAEKCAGTLIEEAANRANNMVAEAEDKVTLEVKRLETAKQYISDIKSSVALTMKNIENVLSAAENEIESKKSDIVGSEERKPSAKEKFEIFEKNIFKRA